MAHDYPNQERCIIVPRSRVRTAIPPPIGVFPGSIGVLNPNLRPQLEGLVPVNHTLLVPVSVPPLNPAHFIRMDEQSTQSLLWFMVNEGLIPTPEDENTRKDAIDKLKQIVQEWIQKIAWQRRWSMAQVVSTSATILTYGSYGLGAHGSYSDIDALCVGPCIATMAEDFFIVLRNMLQNRPEVSELHCIKDAKVPLMRFKFNGISIDLPYSQLKVPSVPENVDILDPSFLRNIDETSLRSLSGVRANMRILQLVPNVEKFQSVLRCLKLWAKRRGVYCSLVGFLGGIHIVVLTAYVCQRHPNASVSFLVSAFFETFASWQWPTPVMLEEGPVPDISETRCLMPIQLPCSPDGFCQSNMTRSTFHKIRTEFHRGHTFTRGFLRPDFEWSYVFEPFPYSRKYKRFLRILIAASSQDELGDWGGWVKSRFPTLLLKVEEVQGLCDPNPCEYVDPDVNLPNMVFYWGLQAGRMNFRDAGFVENYFKTHIMTSGYQGPVGTLELCVVDSSQLPKNAQFDLWDGYSSKPYWNMFDYNHLHRLPVYSYYLPNYVVGFGATNAYPYPNPAPEC